MIEKSKLLQIGLFLFSLLLLCSVVIENENASSKPLITKDFIQPWAILNWDNEDYQKHFDKLNELGINELILQWTIETSGSELKYRLYPSKSLNTNEKYDQVLYKLLKSAKERNMKIYIGLNNDLLWWQDYQNNLEYLEFRVEVSTHMIEEILDLYGNEFKDTISGFYYTFEMYTNRSQFSINWAKMINQLTGNLNDRNIQLPMIYSFFLSEYAGGEEKDISETFELLFKNVSFKANDIITPMDGYGSGTYKGKERDIVVEKYLEIMYEEFTKYQTANFIVNIELFYTNKNQFIVANFDRIQRQLKLAKMYNKEIISFSISHHIILDNNTEIYNDYFKYKKYK